MPFERNDGQYCLPCLAEPPIHDGIRAAVAYGDISRQVALKLKYGGKIGMAAMIAKYLRRHLPEDRTGLVITPVPLHWTRLWSRSYNQSALIGRALAQQNDMTFIPDLMVRQKRTPLLRGMSGKQRQKIVSQAFAPNPRKIDYLKDARILLVDDVYTSGATSNACIKAMKRAGADWVQLFCWARVLRDESQGVIGLDSALD